MLILGIESATAQVGCAIGTGDGVLAAARSVVPPHMRSDGDAFMAAATGGAGAAAPVDEVRLLGLVAVEQAVRSAVGTLDP